MDDIEEIQAELDEAFPGTKLEYVSTWGYWIITDFVCAPDGSPATGIHYPTPWNLLPLEDGEHTNRKLVFLLSHDDTGEPIIPSCENILNTMYRAYTGGSSAAFNRFIDKMEEGEDQLEEEKDKLGNELIRETARVAWDRHKGKVISSKAGVTRMGKTDEFISKQLMAQTHHDMVAQDMSKRRGLIQNGAARQGQLAGA